MSFAVIQKAKIIQDSPVVLLARIVNTSGDPVVHGDFGTITIDVFNADTETKIGSTITLTVANAYGSRHRSHI